MAKSKIINATLRYLIQDGFPGYMCLLDDPDCFNSKYQTGASFKTPDLLFYCDHEKCKGERWHTPDTETLHAHTEDWLDMFIVYNCNNCKNRDRRFSISLLALSSEEQVYGYKYGEFPRQEPKTSPRLLSLLGTDRALFLNGRRCEVQGMGIAAFGYYHRVVEGRRNQIVDQILKVAKQYDSSDINIAKIESSKTDPRFQDTVRNISEIIPSILFVNGANPLSLLHDILSRGIHADSDDKCVELARDIRLVLGAFIEQIDNALKERVELSDAIKRLASSKQTSQNNAHKKDDQSAAPEDSI